MLTVILFLESLGGGELLVIMLFILIFFGSNKIPDLARGLGKGMREIKDAMNGVQSEIRQTMNDTERSVTMPPPPPKIVEEKKKEEVKNKEEQQ
ncbi:MAG: twin-arginine translocase TatA/TatE family subunit [Bacteroidota bacterium]